MQVVVGGQPTSVLDDTCTSMAPGPDSVAVGSLTMGASGEPVTHMGGETAHGGSVTAGSAELMIA